MAVLAFCSESTTDRVLEMLSRARLVGYFITTPTAAVSEVIENMPGETVEKFDVILELIKKNVKEACRTLKKEDIEAHKIEVKKSTICAVGKHDERKLVHLMFDDSEKPMKTYPWIRKQIMMSGQLSLVLLGEAWWEVVEQSINVIRISDSRALTKSAHVLLEFYDETWQDIAGSLLEVLEKVEGMVFVLSWGVASEKLKTMITTPSLCLSMKMQKKSQHNFQEKLFRDTNILLISWLTLLKQM